MRLFSRHNTEGALQHHEGVTPAFVAKNVEAPIGRLYANVEKAASFNPNNPNNANNAAALLVLAELSKTIKAIVPGAVVENDEQKSTFRP